MMLAKTNHNTYTVDELVAGCKKGSRTAQEKIYRLFAPKMLAITLRYAQDTMEAEDILLLAFAKVFNKIDLYSGSGSFEGWVKRVVINNSISVYQQNAKRIKTQPTENYTVEAAAQLTVPCETDYLQQAINSLPPLLSQPFNLFAVEGYTHKEIAAALSITETLSKVKVLRARKMLQEKLKVRDSRLNRTFTVV